MFSCSNSVCLAADIDECAAGTHECEQDCQNLQGSFQCLCELGYALDTDGKSCNGKRKSKEFTFSTFYSLNSATFKDDSENVNPYIPTQTCENIKVATCNHQADSLLYLWPVVWFGD